MHAVSELYEQIASGPHRVQVRVKIDRESYPDGYWILQDNNLDPILTSSSSDVEIAPFPAASLTEGTLFGVTIMGGLFGTESFSIGGCVSREIEVKFILGNAVIPRMAMIQPEVRLVNDAGETSEWIPKGTFWLDTRSYDEETGIMTIRGYDAMLKGEKTYIAPGDVGQWPRTMSSVVTEIAGMIGVQIDPRTTLNSTYMMQLPTDYSMRELLGYVAVANCGNWIITDEGKLRLIRVNDTVDDVDLDLSVMTYEQEEPFEEFSKVILLQNEELYQEAGDDTGRVLEATCPWATETMAQNVLAALDGFIYNPYTADGAILDPAYEIGDYVTINERTGIIANQTMYVNSLCASDIAAPGEAELDHEYPYESVRDREIKRRLNGIVATLYVGPDSIVGRVENLEESTIDSVVVEYAVGTSSTTAPTTGWSSSSPLWTEGYYIWQRTVTTFTDSTVEDPHVVISSPVCIQGAMGEDGVGITSIVPEYYLSTSASSPTGGSWSTTPPTWQSGYYIWTRSHIYWNDSTDTTTTPVLDNATNGLGQRYSELKQTVDGFTLTVTNGSTISTIQLKSGSTVISSQTISMSGLVTFSQLSNPQSQTFIDGANIKTGTISADMIDVSTLKVREVWYYDTFNLYRMLRSVVSGQNTWTNVGPEDSVLDNGYAQILNVYGTQIYFKKPGQTYNTTTGNPLVIDNVNRIFGPSFRGEWDLGEGNFNVCHSFGAAYIDEILFSRMVINGSTVNYEYGDLRMNQSGQLVFTKPNGTSVIIA